jgi:hypothetical protein
MRPNGRRWSQVDHELHAYYSELFAHLTSVALRDGEDVALLDKLIAEYAEV